MNVGMDCVCVWVYGHATKNSVSEKLVQVTPIWSKYSYNEVKIIISEMWNSGTANSGPGEDFLTSKAMQPNHRRWQLLSRRQKAAERTCCREAAVRVSPCCGYQHCCFYCSVHKQVCHGDNEELRLHVKREKRRKKRPSTSHESSY